MCVSVCPHYIYQSHTTHSLSLHFQVFQTAKKIRFSLSLKLETLNLQLSSMATSTSGSGMQLDTRSKYKIKPKTMVIPIESFDVQVESPVDFTSLKRNGMNLESLMEAQQMIGYFHMLNGPTYVNLVKDFWVRAEVYDLEAAKIEETQVVARDPSLKGKTRKEMGLEPFRRTEIRSAVMGIPITITEEMIAKACIVALEGRFLWNVSRKHPLLESYTNLVLKGDPTTKLVEIDGSHRVLLKFITDCSFRREEGLTNPVWTTSWFCTFWRPMKR